MYDCHHQQCSIWISNEDILSFEWQTWVNISLCCMAAFYKFKVFMKHLISTFCMLIYLYLFRRHVVDSRRGKWLGNIVWQNVWFWIKKIQIFKRFSTVFLIGVCERIFSSSLPLATVIPFSFFLKKGTCKNVNIAIWKGA